MNFAGIMLSETSHSPEDRYCMIPLVCGTLCNQISEDRVEGGCQGLGERNGSYRFACRLLQRCVVRSALRVAGGGTIT